MGHVLSQHSSSADHYLLEDVHGSTRLLTDSAAAILTTFDYDAYGQLTAQNGTVETKYLYNGQQYDEVLQLYSLRARYYNPLQGRFLSRDKHTGNYQNELNRYVYTANNPVMFGDPSGMAMFGLAKTLSKITQTVGRALWAHRAAAIKGAFSGLLGYVAGVGIVSFVEAFSEELPSTDFSGQIQFRGEAFLRIMASRLSASVIDLSLNMLLGGFLGAVNEITFGAAMNGVYKRLHASTSGYRVIRWLQRKFVHPAIRMVHSFRLLVKSFMNGFGLTFASGLVSGIYHNRDDLNNIPEVASDFMLGLLAAGSVAGVNVLFTPNVMGTGQPWSWGIVMETALNAIITSGTIAVDEAV